MKGSRVAAGLIALLMASTASAQTVKQVYIAPDDHTDYLWAATEQAYSGYFPRALDAYLDQIDATAGRPADEQAKWNTDGSQWMYEYERQRTPAQMQRLMDRVRDGHISMPLNTLVEVRGSAPLEASIRDMYYAGRLERRYNLRFPLAIAMENQTQSLGIYSVFAGAGARYSWKGVCACATNLSGSGDRSNDAFWATAPDGSRVLTKWMSLQHPLPSAIDPNGNQGPGGYAEVRFPREAVPFVTSDATFQSRWPYDIIGLVGQGWDDAEYIVPLSDTTNSLPAVARDLSNGSRRVIVSDTVDFFRAFEARYGATLPSESVSYGNEWELALATIAEKSARVKRATEKLRAAEAMATLVSLKDGAFLNGRDTARDAAFRAMGLYFEHDIVGGGYAGGNGPRIDFQERQAATLENYVDTLHADAVTRLGQMTASAATGKRFFVFNALGTSRTAPAEIAYPGTGPFTVVQVGTNAEVAAQAIGNGANRRIRFLAPSVPAIGYRLFEVRDTAPTRSFPDTASFAGGVLTTPLYRLSMDGRGAIRSLVEIGRANREWVRDDAGLGLNDLGDGTGTVTLESNGPVSATLRADISGAQPRTVRVTVYAANGRIDIENVIAANFTNVKSYAFPFNIDAPLVRHEEMGVINTAQLAPSGSYSPRGQNALYEWLTLNHFADMTSGSRRDGITLSNSDAYFMRIGHSTLHSLDTTTPRIDVLAGGQASGQPSGELPGQGGDTRFTHHFSLLPHGSYNQLSAMRFALDAQNPLVTGEVTGPARGAALPSSAYSLLSATSSQALVWAVKPAEEGIGSGVIVRLWNQSAASVPVAFRINQNFVLGSTTRTTSIETDVAADDPVALPNASAMRGNQVATFRLALTPR